MCRGSISVFLALLLSASLTVSLACLEHARLYGFRSRLEMAAESAMDSLFAAYDGDVFNDYGLLFLNGESLPGERSMEDDITVHLEKEMNPQTGHLFFSGNLFRSEVKDVWLTGTWSAADRGGELFIRDALDYMKYSLVGIGIDEIMEQAGLVNDGEKAAEEARKQEEESGTAYTLDEETHESTTYDEVTQGSWLEKVKEIREKGWLELIIPIDRVSSKYETTKAGFPSEEYLTYARFFEPLREYLISDQLVFNEYLLESFSCFANVEKPEGMQYQLEYILCGKKSDRKNLESTVLRLLLIREGLNLASLMGQTTMRRKTEAAASAIAGWTGIAPIVLLVQTAIAAGWAFCEAITDLRTLLGGGKVPLVKSEADWVITTDNIQLLLGGNLNLAGNGEKGLDYLAHLRIALFTADMQTKAYRAMDVIQETIRLKRPDFSIASCLYAVTARVTVTAEALFVTPILKEYRFGCTVSRMY